MSKGNKNQKDRVSKPVTRANVLREEDLPEDMEFADDDRTVDNSKVGAVKISTEVTEVEQAHLDKVADKKARRSGMTRSQIIEERKKQKGERDARAKQNSSTDQRGEEDQG